MVQGKRRPPWTCRRSMACSTHRADQRLFLQNGRLVTLFRHHAHDRGALRRSLLQSRIFTLDQGNTPEAALLAPLRRRPRPEFGSHSLTVGRKLPRHHWPAALARRWRPLSKANLHSHLAASEPSLSEERRLNLDQGALRLAFHPLSPLQASDKGPLGRAVEAPVAAAAPDAAHADRVSSMILPPCLWGCTKG